MHDILIKNGTIFDGSGKERYDADIAVNDGKITEIGDLSGDTAREVVDASGLYVSPGFIDISNRSDTRWRLFDDPHLESMLYQGVTTIIGGNSGSSLAPIYNEDMLKSVRKWGDIRDVNVNWQTMKEFLDVIQKHGLSVNFGSFVGYGTLRRGLTGDTSRALTDKELTSIKKHVQEAFERGALGVSTGMIYSHERDVTKEELEILAKIVRKKNKVFVAHLRNEGKLLLESLDELLEIHKKTGMRLHVSHLKAMMKENWPLMEKAIEKIEKTDILFDLYPYTFTETVLYTFLPEWVSDGGRRMMMERLRNKGLREKIVREMQKSGPDLSRAIVAHTERSHYFCGKNFAEIANKQGVTVEDAVIDVLLASEGQVMIFFESMSEENIVRGLKSDHSVISTNGVGYTIHGRNEQLVHPRSFGAFPHIFSNFVKKGDITVEDMICKSSGKVAQELNITDRGIIESGQQADILIFDPNTFTDHSTPDRPYEYASGVQWLLVNGQMAIKYGKYTGMRSGAVIRG